MPLAGCERRRKSSHFYFQPYSLIFRLEYNFKPAMKKTLTLFAALLLFTLAYSQKDLTLKLLAPTSASDIYPMDVFDLAFTVKNTGTVDILPGDSIRTGIRHNGDVLPGFGQLIYHDTLHPGDSVYLEEKFAFAQSEPDSFLFCLFITTTNNGAFENDTLNNSSCTKLLVKSNATSVVATDPADGFSINPNPASDYLVVKAEIAAAAVLEITDATGRISFKSIAGPGTVHVSELNNGIYYCRLLDIDGQLLGSQKLVISR